jgi:hypothetical protein
MRGRDLELWVRDVVDALTAKQPVEDTRVELKAEWIEAEKAARQLAGHANASRGEPILWIIGIDERNSAVNGVDPLEFEGWFKQVQKWFDGESPALVTHINVRINSQTVVGLYFETERYAPYVVTNSKGGYPEFSVPWREGTRLRAAKREELLRLLVPIIKQPQIRLASANLKLTTSLTLDILSRKNRHNWTFEGLVYITPTNQERVVIPYGQCVIWMHIEGYEHSYRLPATFQSLNYKLPKNPEKKTMKIMDKEVDITPPPPRESSTIICADSELIADGPGSAWLTGNGYVLREDSLIPTGSARVTIEITPINSERRIALEASLTPVKKNSLVSTLAHEWST